MRDIVPPIIHPEAEARLIHFELKTLVLQPLLTLSVMAESKGLITNYDGREYGHVAMQERKKLKVQLSFTGAYSKGLSKITSESFKRPKVSRLHG